MEYQAKWGPKGFITSTTKLVPLMDLKVTMAVKSENQSDSSGASKTNVKGTEPEIVSFSTKYLVAAGVDPWGQVEEWRTLLGKSNPLYIGGKRFGNAKFMLKSAEVAEVLMSPAGAFLGLKVTFTFEQNGTVTADTPVKKTTPATVQTVTDTGTSQTKQADFFKDDMAMKRAARALATSNLSADDRKDAAGDIGGRKETEAKSTTASTGNVLSSKVSSVQYQGKTYPVKYWAKYGDWLRGYYYHPVISVDGKNVTVYGYKLVQ